MKNIFITLLAIALLGPISGSAGSMYKITKDGKTIVGNWVI